MSLGRISRQVYWIMVGILIVLTVLVDAVPSLGVIKAGLMAAWLAVWMQRLHDIGRSAWYAVIPIVAAAIILATGFTLGGESFGKFLSGDPESVPDNDAAIITTGIVLLLVLAIHFGFTVWLGIVRGDARANRFGEAPRF